MSRQTVNRPSQKDQEYIPVKDMKTGKTVMKINEAFEGKKGTGPQFKQHKASRVGNVMDSVSVGQLSRHKSNVNDLEDAGVAVKSLTQDNEATAPFDSDIDRLSTILEHSDSFVGKSEHEAIEDVRQFTPAASGDGPRNKVDTGHSLSTLRSLGIAENDGKGSELTLTTYGQSLVNSATNDEGEVDKDTLNRGIVYAASRLPEVGMTRDEVEADWKGGEWSDTTRNNRLNTMDSYRNSCREYGFEPVDSGPGDAVHRRQGAKDQGSREIGAGLGPGIGDLDIEDLMSEKDYARARELNEQMDEAREFGEDDRLKSLKKERRELIERVSSEFGKK